MKFHKFSITSLGPLRVSRKQFTHCQIILIQTSRRRPIYVMSRHQPWSQGILPLWAQHLLSANHFPTLPRREGCCKPKLIPVKEPYISEPAIDLQTSMLCFAMSPQAHGHSPQHMGQLGLSQLSQPSVTQQELVLQHCQISNPFTFRFMTQGRSDALDKDHLDV